MKKSYFYLKTAILAMLITLTGQVSANSSVTKATADPDNWSIWGGNYAGNRYSELNQINKDNVDAAHSPSAMGILILLLNFVCF